MARNSCDVAIILSCFQGEDLLRGVNADLYEVTVGEEICTITEVTDTIILCKPPKEKPDYHTVVKVKRIASICFLL